MNWNDRLGEAAFTSPGGVRRTFAYEDVELSAAARGTMHEFASVNGGYGQRTGVGPRRFPLRCYFSGPDHDLESKGFFESVLESGIGKLEHPRWGPADVVALGDVTLREDLKNEANQSIVEVTLWKTLDSVYPSLGIDLASMLSSALSNFSGVSASAFARAMSLAKAVSRAKAKVTTNSILKEIRSALREVANATRIVRDQFNAGDSAITGGLDLLIGQPLSLASSIVRMVQAPGRSLTSLASRFNAYASLVQNLIDRISKIGATSSPVEEDIEAATNDYHFTDLVVTNAVASMALACAETKLSTRVEAIEAADALIVNLQTAIEWREARARELGIIDTGESFQALQQLVGLTAGYLVQVSFSLLPERRIVLDRPRSIIDLCAELYEEVDTKLDDFISTNGFTGDEILEVPAGRTVVYYV